MPPPELRMSFADRAALARELEDNLRHGRAFLLGAGGVEVLVDCVLVLVHPDSGHEIGLRGQVVMVSEHEPMRGVGVQLRPFDASVLQAMQAFAAGDPDARGNVEIARAAETAVPAVEERATPPPGDLLGEDLLADGDAPPLDASTEPYAEDGPEDALGSEGEPDERDASGERDPGGLFGDEGELDGEGAESAGTEGDAALDGSDDDLLADEDGAAPSDRQQQAPRHERLRKLNVTQQYKLARSGELNDRVLLERIYGKGVWEGLLQNPKLTLPEVARIARKGSVPRPLIEQIVENNAWIQSPLVRRALLSNPRVSGEGILKLLRITPRHELKVIYKTNTYSTQVREAARKVLEM